MYIRKSRLSVRKQSELIKLFVVGSTARAAAEVAGVHRNTAASFFMRLRKLISSKLPSYELGGEVEADESYFGGRRKGASEVEEPQARWPSSACSNVEERCSRPLFQTRAPRLCSLS